jgi:hypothetical protein
MIHRVVITDAAGINEEITGRLELAYRSASK